MASRRVGSVNSMNLKHMRRQKPHDSALLKGTSTCIIYAFRWITVVRGVLRLRRSERHDLLRENPQGTSQAIGALDLSAEFRRP